jgi:hypothetical protein
MADPFRALQRSNPKVPGKSLANFEMNDPATLSRSAALPALITATSSPRSIPPLTDGCQPFARHRSDRKNTPNRQYVLCTTDGKLSYPDRETRSGNGAVSAIANTPYQAA